MKIVKNDKTGKLYDVTETEDTIELCESPVTDAEIVTGFIVLASLVFYFVSAVCG